MDTVVTNFIDQFGVTDKTRKSLSQTQQMYIGGNFCQAENNEMFDIVEPCTEGLLAQVPSATENDVNKAVVEAKQAFTNSEWSKMKPNAREKLLHRLAELVEENSQTLAEIESLDAGKAISGCKAVDIAGSVDLLHYMAGWATKIEGATRDVSAEGEHFAYSLKQPIGVVAAIVPWNWPFSMSIWKFESPLIP
jgi:phenylacetaldehyde dehydrogenase